MHEATQITYGQGIVNIIMNSESLTEVAPPDIRFGDYKDTLKTCFTQKELQEIGAGGTAELRFDYVMTDELSDQQENVIFDKAIAQASRKVGNLEKGVYFEVTATKTIGDEEPEPMDAFYQDMELQIQVPLFLVREDRSYYAMTDVMGTCDLEEDVDEAADTLTISTDDIGTTLILYRDNDPNADTGNSIRLNGSYLILAGLVALAIAWFSVDRMNKKQ